MDDETLAAGADPWPGPLDAVATARFLEFLDMVAPLTGAGA